MTNWFELAKCILGYDATPKAPRTFEVTVTAFNQPITHNLTYEQLTLLCAALRANKGLPHTTAQWVDDFGPHKQEYGQMLCPAGINDNETDGNDL